MSSDDNNHHKIFKYQGTKRETWENYLKDYLSSPKWDHSAYILPLIAHKKGKSVENDQPLKNHIWWCLKDWSALRGHKDFNKIQERYYKYVVQFYNKIRDRGFDKISSINSDKIDKEAEEISKIIQDCSKAIKGVKSPVFGSKLCHFLFLPLVPAFDNEVIKNCVLKKVLKKSRVTNNYKTYFILCWWVIQEMKSEKSLGKCMEYYIDSLKKEGRKKLIFENSKFSSKSLSEQPPESSIAELALTGASLHGNYGRLNLNIGPDFDK